MRSKIKRDPAEILPGMLNRKLWKLTADVTLRLQLFFQAVAPLAITIARGLSHKRLEGMTARRLHERACLPLLANAG